MLFVDDMLWIKNISLQLQGNPFSSWVTMYTMGLSFISYSLHGRRSKGKGKGSNLGARPRAREKGGEESVPLPPFSRALKCFSHIKTIPSLPFWMSSTAEKEEYVFTCNIEILVFYVWSKLSIKDNQSNSMYKSCPLFFLTNKIELVMSAPLQRFSRTVSQYWFHIASLFDCRKCTLIWMGINQKN